jgi:antitoxin (DNA-binding transcriptional repressor) of toxin-antitoxin stability system
MKEITVQRLRQETAERVRLDAQNGQSVITDNGQPIAPLTPLAQPPAHDRLTDREETIRKQPENKVDSAD